MSYFMIRLGNRPKVLRMLSKKDAMQASENMLPVSNILNAFRCDA